MDELAPLRTAISDLLHPGVACRQVEDATGWPIRFAERIMETPVPTERELETLRDIERRTAVAHGRAKPEEGRGGMAPRE